MLPNESFGRFNLICRLASGGMAEVYLARVPGAEGLDKYFALKRILPQLMKDKEFVEMFKTEAKINLNLTQSNIAQIFEFGLEGDQFYLLMEFIDGRDLRQVLTRCAEMKTGFTLDQICYIVSEVAAGLDFAHRCTDKQTGKALRLIHRDVSPQNVMLSFDGDIKIIDFGVAKIEAKISTTKAGTVKGKLSYMSPEQALGEQLDSRTDIFSAGIILWELITGRRLFDFEDDMVTIKKIRECRIPDPRLYNTAIPEDLNRIVMKALNRDRGYRYQTAKELQRDLLSFLHRVNPKFMPEDLSSIIKKLFQKEIEEFRRMVFDIPGASDVAVPDGTKSTLVAHSNKSEVLQIAADSPYFGEQTASKNIKIAPTPSKPIVVKATPAHGIEPLSEDLASEAPVGLKYTSQSGSFAPQAGPEVFNSKELMDGVKVQTKIAVGQQSPEAPPQPPPPQKAPIGDGVIMFRAILAFLFVSAGIYFRADIVNVAKVAEQKGASVRTIVVNLQELIVKREAASVTVNEDGRDDSPRDSSKTSSLQNAKVSIRANPDGSEIDLNGHSFGQAPADLLIPVNTHVTIEIKHDGYSSFKEDFTVTMPRNIDVTLQKSD